jgi:hypothetical protein
MDCLCCSVCGQSNGSRLQQTQLAGTSDRFSAPLDLEFAKDAPIVTFHCAQGKEELPGDLLIGEALSDEPKDFDLAPAEGFEQGLGG